MRQTLARRLERIATIDGDVEHNNRLGLIAGLGMLGAIIALDTLLGKNVGLAGTFVIAPFLAALWADVPATAVVAAAALVAGAIGGIWNETAYPADLQARAVLLLVGGLLAVATAWARERARRSAARIEVLNSIGAVADGSLPLAETLDRVQRVIVPSIADFCMVDAIKEQRVIRSAVRAHGRADARAIERYLTQREPSVPEWMTSPEAPFPRQPRFIPRFNDEDVHRLSHGPADLEWLRSLDLRSTITVPLLARGRMLGALTVTTAWSGRRYSIADVRFVQTLAGRVALALDNAGLFSDLESVERRMDSVMSMLDEAIVIHDAQGELVFANPSAARQMGLDAEDPTAVETEKIRERFVIRAEDGSLVPPEELVGRRALSGTAPQPLMLRVTDREGGAERWLITRAKPIMGPDGRALYSVTAIEDVTAVKRAEFAQRLLARAGELLATTDYSDMLAGVADLAVPEFADWCTVNVPAESGVIDQVAIAHLDEDRRRQVTELQRRFPFRVSDEAGIAEVLRTGAGQLIAKPEELLGRVAASAEHEEELRSLGIGSVILAPIASSGRVLGVLAFGNPPGARVFDEYDLELAVELARRAGTALEIARLAQERAEVAKVLQEGLMPRALPHMPGWETAAVYQPAGEVNAVGGDFYDAFEIEDGWMVIVGDVVGRGAAAASLTALARHTIRTAGSLTGDPCKALAMLDDALRARGENALCTALILVLPHTASDDVHVSLIAAGHPLPLLVRDGAVSEVGIPGPLLGAFEGSEWTPVSVELRADDQLVLFTDGVIEAKGPETRFGEERLRENLAGTERPMHAIGRVSAALEAFLGGDPEDDVALVAIRRLGALPGAGSSQEKQPRAAGILSPPA